MQNQQTQVYLRRKPTKKILLTCACGCGEQFLRYRKYIKGEKQFLNNKHQARYCINKHLEDYCGPMLPLVNAYLQQSANARYRRVSAVRATLYPFFLFLQEQGLAEISLVVPETVSAYVKWAAPRYKSAIRDLSSLRVFFTWCITEELYESENPVIPTVHCLKKKKRLVGRPYSEDEICSMRHQIAHHGSVRAQAIFELALESGLRNGEICRLKLADVDLESKSILVDTPNKGMRQRQTFIFSERCIDLLKRWKAERRDCSHPYLFHNFVGGECTVDMMCTEFKKIFAVRPSEEGSPDESWSFSLHRLRHTFASRLATHKAEPSTLQELCGWQNLQTAMTYIAIGENAVARSFAESSTKAQTTVEWTTMTDEEFLAEYGCAEPVDTAAAKASLLNHGPAASCKLPLPINTIACNRSYTQ